MVGEQACKITISKGCFDTFITHDFRQYCHVGKHGTALQNDCQDVDEAGTEPSSDADSDLFGLYWCDDLIMTINSVTERNDKVRGGKESLALVNSGAVDNVLPK